MKIYPSKLLNNFSNLTHAFTTKDGGVSHSPYNSLNLAFHVGDNSLEVITNHELLATNLKYNKKTLVHMKQIHSNMVHIVDENDNFENPPICDAMVTDKLKIPLMVMVADCSPILFYDKKLQVIAVAHAGRKGTFKNIVKKVIDTFTNHYNSDAMDIYVSIGPSIDICCYEVGSEIYKEAKEMDLEYAMQVRDNNFYLNIRTILKSQLMASGIKEQNIEISDECSCCQNSKYFSYRADGTTGRFCGVICLN